MDEKLAVPQKTINRVVRNETVSVPPICSQQMALALALQIIGTAPWMRGKWGRVNRVQRVVGRGSNLCVSELLRH